MIRTVITALLVCALAIPLPACSFAMIKGPDARGPTKAPDCGARVGGEELETEFLGTDLSLGIVSLLLGAFLIRDPDLCFTAGCDPDPDSNLPTIGAVSLGIGVVAVTSFLIGLRAKRRCDAARDRHRAWVEARSGDTAP